MSVIIVWLALTILSFQNSVNGGITNIMSRGGITNVMSHGAKGDGVTDDAQAFQSAWEVVCKGGGTLLIPEVEESFLLNPTTFSGPCKARTVTVKVEGNVDAPTSKKGWTDENCRRWITIKEVNNLVIEGYGSFNGHGEKWWNMEKGHDLEAKDGEDDSDLEKQIKKEHKKKKHYGDNDDDDDEKGHITCGGRGQVPTNLAFFGCNHLRINYITSLHSPKNHFSISQCNDVEISNIKIKAPYNSPNTDGIDISHTVGVIIKDSHIATGDDCVELNTRSSDVNITNVDCGPGHGISIGSFKRKGADVQNVYVRECNFTGTKNGARIKTFSQSVGGYVRSITFEQITLKSVKHPIIINQDYQALATAGRGSDEQGGGGVKISDVKFIGFEGTCSSKDAIVLNCSSRGSGCTDIELRNIKIRGESGKESVRATCRNAHGYADSTTPKVTCLIGDDDDDHHHFDQLRNI
uniref:Polygalacturonase n=1 Tax=Kalanchoe fedtschenkoi TaxID=63787 RepID=A0A7N1A6Q3_KALFE